MKPDDQPDELVLDLTEGATRSPSPRQHWSRRPPEVVEVAAGGSAAGPAWAPASWRVGTGDAAAVHVRREEAVAVHSRRDEAPAARPTVAAHSEKDDVLAVAAREIDRMTEEIRDTGASEEQELSVLQDHARRLEALTRANPFLRVK